MDKTAAFKTFKLLLVALITTSFLFNLKILWDQRSYMAQGYFDFVIYYTGAEIVNAGKARDLYNLDLQKRHQEQFNVPNKPWLVLPF
jgi:hypothetical protein